MRADLIAPALMALVIVENPLAGAVEIIVLTRLEAPEERPQGADTHHQGDRNQKEQARHARAFCNSRVDSGWPARRNLSRSALPTTTNDEADIAIAARRGVTCPATASGTASAL